MFNDLLFSGLISALMLVTALAGCLGLLCKWLYTERLNWIKRYAALTQQIEQAQKETLELLFKELDGSSKTTVAPLKKDLPESYN